MPAKKKTPRKKATKKAAPKKAAPKKAKKKATKKKAVAYETFDLIDVDSVAKVRFYKDKAGEFRWTVLKRGRIIGASTEGYKRKAAVYSNFNSLADTLHRAVHSRQASQRPRAA